MSKNEKLNVQNKIEKIVDYVYCCTEKSPKKLRHDIIPQMRKYSLYALENVIKANRIVIDKNASEEAKKIRYNCQVEADVAIQSLETLADICLKRYYITKKQFDYLTTLTFEFRKMINSWIAADKKALS